MIELKNLKDEYKHGLLKQLLARYMRLPEPELQGKIEWVLQDHLRGRGIEALKKDEEKAILKASDEEILTQGEKAVKLLEGKGAKIIPERKPEEEKRAEVEDELVAGIENPLLRAMIRCVGVSIHDDFRYKMDDYLLGWTLLGLRFGLEFVFTAEPGMKGRKIRVEPKATQPLPWLKGNEISSLITERTVELRDDDVFLKAFFESSEGTNVGSYDNLTYEKMEGRVPPGTVGATREKAGLFRIRDRGILTLGAMKPYFKEYFLEGEKVFKKTRVVIVGVKLPKLDPETKKPIKGYYQIVWNLWVPYEQVPYAITERAKKKGYVPPKDFIPIPKYWMEENKHEYNEWLNWVEEMWKKYPKGRF